MHHPFLGANQKKRGSWNEIVYSHYVFLRMRMPIVTTGCGCRKKKIYKSAFLRKP